MKKYCYSCIRELLPKEEVDIEMQKEKKHDHGEHIIPNGIGGKLVSTGILCNYCGGKYGIGIDKALNECCESFVYLSNTDRDRKDARPLKVEYKDGSIDRVDIDGNRTKVLKGAPAIPLNADGLPDFSIEVKSKQEREAMQGRIKKDFPDINIKSTPQLIYDSSTGKIGYPWCEDAYKGVAKIAVGFFMSKGGCRTDIQGFIPYLDKPVDYEFRPVALYYPSSLNTDSLGISHTIILQSDRKNKTLFCYIKLFNTLGFLVCLNDGGYEGKDINECYNYNLLDRKEEALSLCFDNEEAQSFLRDIAFDYCNGNNYLFRDDMKQKFEEELKKFEKIIDEKKPNPKLDSEFRELDW
ncbi:hypothetical protein V9L05_18240 [Bernardetia sp. Wsw4-3y2]|uniref:hypothetical protein n=1 Tax=Bernardetia sp. Wsw4-3y2 TaxID=3127471 RepID=UPI0030D1E6A8